MVTIVDFGHFLGIDLRTPELVSVCTVANSEEKNQIIINSMKHGMCNIHINDY